MNLIFWIEDKLCLYYACQDTLINTVFKPYERMKYEMHGVINFSFQIYSKLKI